MSVWTWTGLQNMILITNSHCDTFVNPNRTNSPDHEDEDIGARAPYTPWASGALPQRGNGVEEGDTLDRPLDAFGRAPRGHGSTFQLAPPDPAMDPLIFVPGPTGPLIFLLELNVRALFSAP